MRPQRYAWCCGCNGVGTAARPPRQIPHRTAMERTPRGSKCWALLEAQTGKLGWTALLRVETAADSL
jgi:hypothetical protein